MGRAWLGCSWLCWLSGAWGRCPLDAAGPRTSSVRAGLVDAAPSTAPRVVELFLGARRRVSLAPCMDSYELVACSRLLNPRSEPGLE